MKLQEPEVISDVSSVLGDKAVLAAFGEKPIYALLQGYKFTTFTLVRDKQMVLPSQFGNAEDWNDLFDARIFNKNAEIHAWKCNGADWIARIRTDCPGEDTQFVLWGTRWEEGDDDNFVLVEEKKRGVHFWVPREVVIGASLPLKLKVREYLEPDQTTGLVHVVDFRLCGFV
jgi:CRISPR-associated protein (TIGR03984 family)